MHHLSILSLDVWYDSQYDCNVFLVSHGKPVTENKEIKLKGK